MVHDHDWLPSDVGCMGADGFITFERIADTDEGEDPNDLCFYEEERQDPAPYDGAVAAMLESKKPTGNETGLVSLGEQMLLQVLSFLGPGELRNPAVACKSVLRAARASNSRRGAVRVSGSVQALEVQFRETASFVAREPAPSVEDVKTLLGGETPLVVAEFSAGVFSVELRDGCKVELAFAHATHAPVVVGHVQWERGTGKLALLAISKSMEGQVALAAYLHFAVYQLPSTCTGSTVADAPLRLDPVSVSSLGMFEIQAVSPMWGMHFVLSQDFRTLAIHVAEWSHEDIGVQQVNVYKLDEEVGLFSADCLEHTICIGSWGNEACFVWSDSGFDMAINSDGNILLLQATTNQGSEDFCLLDTRRGGYLLHRQYRETTCQMVFKSHFRETNRLLTYSTGARSSASYDAASCIIGKLPPLLAFSIVDDEDQDLQDAIFTKLQWIYLNN